MTHSREALEGFTRDFYREVDDNDATVFDRRFAATAAFDFNDFPTSTGPDEVSAMVAGWKGGFTSVHHDLRAVLVDVDKATTVSEIAVNYVFKDDTSVSVSGCSISSFDDEGLMTGWRVYVDTTRSNPPS
ncbi:nuclear transport factor 2 family protein [Rhodococcoides fascians]|uniref:nuclear transport factor 2 family protein n=1 Tax=Rhodococcoides fascians TaxID=1828 RepID=UPI002ACD967A|nr:nuclear transport factor 2 family protein [Rhodococcus fascians]WQH28800.1 nuclear transport factor 2 family protein [Rhodococcus fascians]